MISFAITTHNEGEYIQKLLEQLITHTKITDSEIVILDDFSTDERTNEILNWAQLQPKVTIEKRNLNNNFAEQKNYLNSLCKGDYIFQIDADELLHPHLLSHVDSIVKSNSEVELFLIPRVNVVDGLTAEDISKWGWIVNENNWVMWPDYQTRIYKNIPSIKWESAVHERVVGYEVVAKLPAEEEWAIYHVKDIDRQRKQNDYYATIQR